jgi:hypothetical protein
LKDVVHPAINPAVAEQASHFVRDHCHMPSMHSKWPQREHFGTNWTFALVDVHRRYSGFGFFSPGHLPVVR